MMDERMDTAFGGKYQSSFDEIVVRERSPFTPPSISYFVENNLCESDHDLQV